MTDWNPNLGTKIGPAWQAIVANLRDREWGSDRVAITIAMHASDIRHATARNLIWSAIRHGYLEARPATDQPGRRYKQIRLTERAA